VSKQIRTRPVTVDQGVRAYAGKAQEYADASVAEVDSGRFVAATSLAEHAGINAADAVCGARLGRRAAAEDHDQVVALLGRAGRDGGELVRELRRLLPLKTTAEYEPDDIARSTPTKAAERGPRDRATGRGDRPLTKWVSATSDRSSKTHIDQGLYPDHAVSEGDFDTGFSGSNPIQPGFSDPHRLPSGDRPSADGHVVLLSS
jgi:hypothetical protein